MDFQSAVPCCDVCDKFVTVEQRAQLRALEDQFKNFLLSLIECIEEMEQSGSRDTQGEIRDLMNSPPGITALSPDHYLVQDMHVIRAKYFLLAEERSEAAREFEFTCSL